MKLIIAAIFFFIPLLYTYVCSFVDQINEAFGSQLVMHFTLISLVISVLGFEILIVTHKESVMYILHLIGWFVILYNVCHYGQILINEVRSSFLTSV